MKKYLLTLTILALSLTLFAQNAFDKRVSDPKKPYKGLPVGNAQTVSGKKKNSIPIKGSFPVSFSLTKHFKNYSIEWNEDGNCAISITPLSPIYLESKIVSLNSERYLENVLIQLGAIKKLLQLNDPSKELKLISTQEDDLGYTHLKFKQHLNGVMVMGGEITVHIKENALESITNRLYPTPSRLKLLGIDSLEAIKMVTQDIDLQKLDEIGNSILGNKRLEVERIIYHLHMDHQSEIAGFKVLYRPNLLDWWEYIIDGYTGQIIGKTNKTCSIDGPRTASAQDLNSVTRTFNTYQVGSSYYLIDANKSMFDASASKMPNDPSGTIWTIDAKNSSGTSLTNISSSNNTWSNKSSVSAH